jgi:hypothetical protein
MMPALYLAPGLDRVFVAFNKDTLPDDRLVPDSRVGKTNVTACSDAPMAAGIITDGDNKVVVIEAHAFEVSICPPD